MKNQLRFATLLLLLLFFFLNPNSSFAQAPNYLWAKSAGGTALDYGQSVATDANGNAVVTGYFKSTSITFGTTTLNNASSGGNSTDFYIVKYDANGNVLWAKRAGGTFYEYGAAVATDSSGNILVTGSFNSPSITFGTTTITSTGSADFFIVKYDPDGNVIWAKSQGGIGQDFANSIATDTSGNVLVTGYFQSPSMTFGTTTVTQSGFLADVFIVKYDAAGTALWAKAAGGDAEERGNSIAADANGNVLVTGFFDSNSITFGTTTLTNPGFSEIFIVKYGPDGTLLWAKSQGGTRDDQGTGIAADPSGSILLTGYFKSPTVTFGSTTLNNSNAQADYYIVKYDAAGTVLWAKGSGGDADDSGNGVVSDSSGNVYVTGYFQSPSIGFGTVATTLPNAGSADIFIVKYNAAGTVQWAKSAGGASLDYGQSITITGSGNLLVAGWFSSNSITFGNTALPNTGGGNPDMYVYKLSSDSLGIADEYNEAELGVYPNPVSDSFIVDLLNYENASAALYNAEGRLMLQCALKSKETTINTDNLANGIYFLKLKTEKGISVKKIVVKR